MTKEQEIRLSDKELAAVQAYADERGMTLDEAATELTQDAIAKKFRKNLNRAPAKVYSLPRNKS
jgi:hypothetical protein